MADDYVLGHAERELRRLERQAGFYADATREGLLKAGLAPGMTVLDLGCGAGDVSFIAADLVGPAGRVTGIDVSEGAIAVSRGRATQRGLSIAFEPTAIEAFSRYADFDAIIGRFVLVHFRDPAGAIRDIAGRARAGALLVSMEMDVTSTAATAPLPLLQRHVGNIARMYSVAGLNPDMGRGLHAVYRAAGLQPRLAATTPVGDRTQAAGFEFFAESVRSLLPMMEKLGITTAAQTDPDTLAERLAEEAAATDPAVYYPRFTTAWART